MIKKIIKILSDPGFRLLMMTIRFDLMLLWVQTFFVAKKNSYKIQNVEYKINFNNFNKITNLKISNTFEEHYTLELTGFNITLSSDIFYLKFIDQESFFSVYRFRWLLLGIEKYKNCGFVNQSITILNHWICNYEDLKDNVSETYSVCERLLNITYFISILKDNSFKDMERLEINKLSEIFHHEIEIILSNIEENGQYTNNHILNNARALYILGGIFGLDNIQKEGRKILFQYFDSMIKDGILIEGSFHYQILLTRSMLEIYLVAKNDDDSKVVNFLTLRLQKMLSITRGLHSNVSNDYPLIGDVSPDFPVDFFSGFPFTNSDVLTSKWNNIFNFNYIFDTMPLGKSRFQYWEKYDFDNIEIWIITKKYGIMPHGHNDNGSFFIFFKGTPIIHDTGRASYANSINMVSQNFHNGILFSKAIDIDCQSYFKNIFDLFSNVKIDLDNNILYVSIRDYSGKYNYKYQLNISNNIVEIDSKNSINLFIKDEVFNLSMDELIFNEFRIKFKDKNLTINKIIASNDYGSFVSMINIRGM